MSNCCVKLLRSQGRGARCASSPSRYPRLFSELKRLEADRKASNPRAIQRCSYGSEAIASVEPVPGWMVGSLISPWLSSRR